MKKKFIAMMLGIILAVSSGCGARSAASRFCAALEDAGFMYEADFNAAYYGGRFETADKMYEQLRRDGVTGIIVPVSDEAECPGLVEYSAYELNGIYFDSGSIFFPSAAHAALAEFENTAAAEDFYSQIREELLAAADGKPSEDSERRIWVTTGDGMTLLSQKGRTVLLLSGEEERAFSAAEKIGF